MALDISWFMVGDMVNVTAVLKFARTYASNKGLSVEFDEGCPRTNGRTIYVRKPDAAMDRDKLVMWLYDLMHEIGHNVEEMADIFPAMKAHNIQGETLEAFTLNILDDHREEHHKHDELEGKQRILAEGRKLMADGIDLTNYGQSAADTRQQAVETLFAWDFAIRTEWQPSLTPVAYKFLHKLNPQQTEWYGKLCDGDYESILKSGITADEEVALTRRIITEVFNLDPDGDKKPQKGESETEEGEGEGQEGDGEEGKGQGDGEQGEGEEGESKEGGTVKYSDFLLHSHEEVSDVMGGSPYKIEYDANVAGFDDTRPVNTIDYEKGEHTHAINYRVSKTIDKIDSGRGLATKVRKLLQVAALSKYRHGLKSGKISPKSLYRAGMRNSGEAQRRVFRKKDVAITLDSAVTVLIDSSGSMGSRQKYEHAAKAVLMLNEAISPLGVPLEIVAFDDKYDGALHGLLKSSSKRVTEEELTKRLAMHHDAAMSGNADGHSIMWAYNRLTQRKEKRKLLIVLSDGSPAGYGGDADWHTKQVIDNIEKERVVELYGIGIMDNNVERLYTSNAVIDRADQLEEALLKIVKTKLIA